MSKKKMNTEEKIVDIIADQLDVKREIVKLESTFLGLGADGLDILEIIMWAEEGLEVTLPDDLEDEIKTVGDIVLAVKKAKGE